MSVTSLLEGEAKKVIFVETILEKHGKEIWSICLKQGYNLGKDCIDHAFVRETVRWSFMMNSCIAKCILLYASGLPVPLW